MQNSNELHEKTQSDIKSLETKIHAARAKHELQPHMKKDYAQAQLAWRMVIELVTGLLLGFGVGYGIDVLAGTTPVFMIIFIGLGFAAGIKTVMRSAKELQLRQESQDLAEIKDE